MTGVFATRLTNKALADRLKKEVWADMEVFTPGCALVGEAIDRLSGKCPYAMQIEAIKREVAESCGVSVGDLESASRKQHIVRARRMAIRRCRRQTGATLEFIGECFNRTHATVLHAINSGCGG